MPGVLDGIRIIEFAGIGPAPFCGMMLADHGAEIIRISRVGAVEDKRDPTLRSRRNIALDLKNPKSQEIVKKLIKKADGLMEGFRPGVMERLGFGPDEMLSVNDKLIYGRMTGWGQTGPYAQAAGHDINYISLSGVLHMFGREGQNPTPPANLVGDYGGGGMMLAFGMVSGLLAVKNGAAGQVIDCAMTDGSAALSAAIWGLLARGWWEDKTGVNILDTGAHFYDTYKTKDGKWISIGAIEPQFYALLREKTGLDKDPEFDQQVDKNAWPKLKEKLTGLFLKKTRDEWCEVLEMTDACFAPVLSMGEAPNHPHNLERGTFIDVGGVKQPGPAPAFSTNKARRPIAPTDINANTDEILGDAGYSVDEIAQMRADGIAD